VSLESFEKYFNFAEPDDADEDASDDLIGEQGFDTGDDEVVVVPSSSAEPVSTTSTSTTSTPSTAAFEASSQSMPALSRATSNRRARGRGRRTNTKARSASQTVLDPAYVVSQEAAEQFVTKIHTILRPFLLRREKRNIGSLNLPKRYEKVVYTSLSPLQKVRTLRCTWCACVWRVYKCPPHSRMCWRCRHTTQRSLKERYVRRLRRAKARSCEAGARSRTRWCNYASAAITRIYFNCQRMPTANTLPTKTWLRTVASCKYSIVS